MKAASRDGPRGASRRAGLRAGARRRARDVARRPATLLVYAPPTVTPPVLRVLLVATLALVGCASAPAVAPPAPSPSTPQAAAVPAPSPSTPQAAAVPAPLERPLPLRPKEVEPDEFAPEKPLPPEAWRGDPPPLAALPGVACEDRGVVAMRMRMPPPPSAAGYLRVEDIEFREGCASATVLRSELDRREPELLACFSLAGARDRWADRRFRARFVDQAGRPRLEGLDLGGVPRPDASPPSPDDAPAQLDDARLRACTEAALANVDDLGHALGNGQAPVLPLTVDFTLDRAFGATAGGTGP